MLIKRKGSFATRLSLGFMFILTGAVIMLTLGFLFFLRSMVRGNQVAGLKNAEAIVYEAFNESLKNQTAAKAGDETAAEEDSDTLFLFPDIPYFLTYIIYNPQTEEVLATNDPFLPLLKDTRGRAVRFYKKDFFFDGDLDVLYFAVKHETVVVAVAENIENNAFSKLMEKLPPALLLMVLPILLISFCLSLFITKNTISPVVKITKAARAMTTEKLGGELPVSGRGDEIDELSSAFNELFTRIKADFDRERQFSSDVSHELNTPLTVISGQANLLLRWGKDNPEQLEKSLNAIKNESKSMHAIIENLLQISRIESGRIKPQLCQLDLHEVFERVSDEFEALAPQAHFEFDYVNEGGCNLNTDPEMLHQLITVLVSNSVKFAGQQCRVKLQAEKKDDAVFVRVQDDGPGIAPEALPHIFERFYRADQAHVRAAGGSGLGLSIAKTLCAALTADISAYNIEPHGAVFEIRFDNQ
jgi:signal transduction histidine kinase